MYLYIESLIIDPREFENFFMREKSFLRKTGSLGCNQCTLSNLFAVMHIK